MGATSAREDSLLIIIRSYKSAVTKHANRLGLENGWHRSYHDSIIRDSMVIRKDKNYIPDNVENGGDNLQKFTAKSNSPPLYYSCSVIRSIPLNRGACLSPETGDDVFQLIL